MFRYSGASSIISEYQNMHREEAIQLSKKYAKGKPIFLDSETTGLGLDAEIVDLAVIGFQGKVLFKSLIRPKKRIPADATRIHKITNKMVSSSPSWEEVWPKIHEILRDKTVGIYNADYDTRLLKQSTELSGLKWTEPYREAFCVMKLFSKYIGIWSDYYNNYRWHRLEVAASHFGIRTNNLHRALDDTKISRSVFLNLTQ